MYCTSYTRVKDVWVIVPLAVIVNRVIKAEIRSVANSTKDEISPAPTEVFSPEFAAILHLDNANEVSDVFSDNLNHLWSSIIK